MKLYTASRKLKEGSVSISIGGKVDRLFHFPIDTLFDWYPCCPRYTYQYSTSRRKFYIRLSDSDKTLKPYYGVSNNSKRASSKIACFKEGEWYNKEVAEDNQKLFKLAQEYGIVTPLTKDYTLEQVDKSIESVLDIFDLLYSNQKAKVEDELLAEWDKYKHLPLDDKNAQKIQKEVSYYTGLSREEKVSYLLANPSTELKNTYDTFGCIYTMLITMRKVVE